MWHIRSVQYVIVFTVILLSAKFGQYLFFEWETSPAVLWPPTGIALAVMWLGGYRFAIPIFLALLTSAVTGPLGHVFPTVITSPLAQLLGVVACVYLLKVFNFDDTFWKTRNVLIFLATITVACMVAPTINTSIGYRTGTLSSTALISWSRAWAGYILSCLILTPFIITWFTKERGKILKRDQIEELTVLLFLLTSVFFCFGRR